MALPPLLLYADELLEGGLAEFISSRRNAELSWHRIARELWVVTDHRVDTSGVTVQSWAKRLELECAA